MIVAHKSEDGRLQSIEDHAKGVAELASGFAEVFGYQSLGYAAGIFHDIGKKTEGFQRRILNNGPKVEHSSAGALIMKDTGHLFGLFLAYCIAGHHGGLPDFGTSADTEDEGSLQAKLKREKGRAYKGFLPFMDIADPKNLLPNTFSTKKIGGRSGGFSASFLIRMLFSCLVDADYLDTETFMMGKAADRDMGEINEEILKKFESHVLEKFSTPTRDIDKWRCKIREECIEKAKSSHNLFSLTVPTGGGKTLSSMAFAIQHAKQYGKRRIIYVIPYTSIIEQTADIFRRIFGEGVVLEHHSNVQYDDQYEEMNKARMAAENWAAPIIVTTNVQFFESFFSNRSSRCRKLHNIANSVIIFDEAQMLPVPYLLPCLWTIAELVENYRCTALLMSATQPALDQYFPDQISASEISESIPEMYQFFKRAQIKMIGELTQDELGQLLNSCEQALCIVNSRKQAQELYKKFPQDEGSFHLSTLMPPVLRKQRLKMIRERLDQGLPCRVVSTSLIEAGVDVDFPVVYREEAGLDSQVQAAGRCNREAKKPLSESIVYVYRIKRGEAPKIPNSLRLPIEVSRIVGESHTDPGSPEAIYEFFKLLYKNKGEGLDQKNIVEGIEQCIRANFSFASIAQLFHLIENETKPVFIALDKDAEAIAEQLRKGKRNRNLMRKAGIYQVSIYQKDFERLEAAGAIEYAKVFQENVLREDKNLAILVNINKWFDLQIGLVVPDLGIGLFM